MAILTRASNELFKRKPDECFPNMADLFRHCQQQKENAVEKWISPSEVRPVLFDSIPSLQRKVRPLSASNCCCTPNDWPV